MNVQQAYALWSKFYDFDTNKTRDVEAIACRTLLQGLQFENCLEIGCGTGKNTTWLSIISNLVTAVDLTEEMLSIAKQKIIYFEVIFQQADILEDWKFGDRKYDLITFSLVLEHIEHLEPIFEKAKQVIAPNGKIYLGELHPFKQYQGSKPRFLTQEGTQVVPCFTHDISEFSNAAKKAGFEIKVIQEFFDEDNQSGVPRILGMVFQHSNDISYPK